MRSSKVDARADVWALGVTLFWLVTGKRPFEGDSIVKIYESILRGPPPMASLRPGVPPALEDLVRRCLQWNPEERLASVAAFVTELRAMDLSGAEEGPRLGSGEGVLATVAAAPLLDDAVGPPSVPPPSSVPISVAPPSVPVASQSSEAVQRTALLDPRSVPPEPPPPRSRVPLGRVAAVGAAVVLLGGAYLLGTMQSAAASTARAFAPTLLVALDDVELPEAEPVDDVESDESPNGERPMAETTTEAVPRPAVRPALRPTKRPAHAPPKQPASGDEVWGMP